VKIKVSKTKNDDRNGVSHGVKCSQEGDRMPLWRAMDSRWNKNIIAKASCF